MSLLNQFFLLFFCVFFLSCSKQIDEPTNRLYRPQKFMNCPMNMSINARGICMDDQNRWIDWWSGVGPIEYCSSLGGYVCISEVDYECADGKHSAKNLKTFLGCSKGVGGNGYDYYDNGDFIDGDSFRCCLKYDNP